MTFAHPLARTSHIVSTAGMKGKARQILVIVTKLQLDKDHKKYKEDLVKRLSEAAESWIGEHPDDVSDYMLMNRPKKWEGDKD